MFRAYGTFCSSSGYKLLRSEIFTPNNVLLKGKHLNSAQVLTTVRFNSSENEKKSVTTLKDKATNLFKTYGKLAIVTYAGIYLTTLGSMFVLLEYDVLNSATFGLDPAVAIEKVCNLYETLTGSKSLPDYIRQHPSVGTFAIGWVITKFTEPIRLATTVAVVPIISRYLRRSG